MSKTSKRGVRYIPKLNFQTRKLGAISVFYAVDLETLGHFPLKTSG